MAPVQEPAVRCYSRDTGNEGARDSCMHTGVIVSMRKEHSRMGKKVCDAEAGNCPPSGLPWRLQCNIQAYAASQPSGGGRRGGASEWHWGGSHSRDGVRHACMGRELSGAGWARYSAGCRREGTDCLASPVWFMVGSSAD